MKILTVLFAVGLCALTALAVPAAPAQARGYEYGLAADQIADGVYVFWGKQEALTVHNGGNIVNTGFIVGEREVLVIDTGPTRFYGEQIVAAIAEISDLRVRRAVVTHHHQDHSLGINALKHAGASVIMHPGARALLARDGEQLLVLMKLLVGEGWMAATRVDKPTGAIAQETVIDLGNRPVRIIPLEGGHTAGDLVVLDERTGTLFAGDLVFIGRAATVPHADLPTWLGHLDTLAALPWQRLVPGHGPLVTDRAAFAPLRDYLAFLGDYAARMVAQGNDLAESLNPPELARFSDLATLEVEFRRSMMTLFRRIEGDAFDAAVAAY